MSTAPILRNLITLDAAADHLGVCRRTIRRHIAEGRLTGYRVGRLIRLDAAEVDALAAPIPTVSRDVDGRAAARTDTEEDHDDA